MRTYSPIQEKLRLGKTIEGSNEYLAQSKLQAKVGWWVRFTRYWFLSVINRWIDPQLIIDLLVH